MSNDQSAEHRKPEQGDPSESRQAETAAADVEENDARSEEPGAPPAAGAAPDDGAGLPDSDLDAAAAAEAGTADAPETTEPSEASETPEAEIARLSAELEAARGQGDENWQRYLRSEAEKENIRKRAEKGAENARKQGMEKLANELLSVRDSLELGVDAAAQEDADIEKIREGTELTLKMLVQAMEKCNIEEIDPAGERFDPDLHQAMSMQEIEGQESNTVVSVMQKGYRLGDRLLRPALVMVAK